MTLEEYMNMFATECGCCTAALEPAAKPFATQIDLCEVVAEFGTETFRDFEGMYTANQIKKVTDAVRAACEPYNNAYADWPEPARTRLATALFEIVMNLVAEISQYGEPVLAEIETATYVVDTMLTTRFWSRSGKHHLGKRLRKSTS
jgi:hypothetical protein